MTHEDRSKILTPREQRFVDEVLVDPNDNAAAYMRATGTTNKKSASVQASKLMKKEKVKNAIAERAKEVIGCKEAQILKNVEFWIGIRDGKIDGQEPIKNLVSREDVEELLNIYKVDGEELMKALDELDKYSISPIQVPHRIKASEYLAKYQQMFVEKSEVSIEAQVVIVDDIPMVEE